MTTARQGFGIDALDRLLGGGLLPGTLTVVAGATGAGKTQLGLRWADAGRAAEGHRGVICDLTSRGDAQNHARYAQDLFGWDLSSFPSDAPLDLGLGLGLRAADRRLFPSLRPRRPSRDAPRPRARRLARLEDRPGARPADRGRLLLRALRPGDAPGRRRRDRADRAVRRLDPVRVLRVSLSPGPPQGGRVGRPRALPRAVPRQQPPGPGASLRPPGPSAASTSTRPPTSCSTT